MERLYKFLLSVITPSIKAWGVYFVSVVLNQLGDSSVINGETSFLERMTCWTNSSILILYAFTALVILESLVYLILKPIVLRSDPTPRFAEIMKRYTDPILVESRLGGLSWGADISLYLPPVIVEGWKPQQIMIEKYDSSEYAFHKFLDPKLDRELRYNSLCDEYLSYLEKDETKNIQRIGNDLRRYMITRAKPNANRINPGFVIDLKATYWNQTSFIWGKAKADVSWKKTTIEEQLRHNITPLPNSLCLHLIIETSDQKVIVSGISEAKSNDYPQRKAVSLGEQVEALDFRDSKDIQEEFITKWVQRAVMEEFGLDDENYNKLFDSSSIRVLGFNLEGDIINYSFPTLIRMKVDCATLHNFVKNSVDGKEISGFYCIDPKEIPGICVNAKIYSVKDKSGIPKEDNSNEWHPSSYLRLLLYYLHRNGWKKTCREFLKAEKALSNKSCFRKGI